MYGSTTQVMYLTCCLQEVAKALSRRTDALFFLAVSHLEGVGIKAF